MRTKSALKLILRLRSLISKRIPNKDNYKFGTDPTMEEIIGFIRPKKSNLDRPFGVCGAADSGDESLRFQVSIVRR